MIPKVCWATSLFIVILIYVLSYGYPLSKGNKCEVLSCSQTNEGVLVRIRHSNQIEMIGLPSCPEKSVISCYLHDGRITLSNHHHHHEIMDNGMIYPVILIAVMVIFLVMVFTEHYYERRYKKYIDLEKQSVEKII